MAIQTALVALVGRPNVGKSTLFNRIVGKRLAVVSEIAGTTRDRVYADAEWNGETFTVVDTGGIELLEGWHTEPLSEDSEKFLPMIRAQARVAIEDADLIIMVVDGMAGLTAADREVAEILQQANKPVLIAANKLESDKLLANQYEFYELALGDIYPMSALHGRGVADMLDAIVETLPPSEELPEDESIRVALLGRPNVGKSTLLNRIIGAERAIVSPIAGTTRDAVDTKLTWHGEPFTLVDTAGIRRRGKIDPGVERYSVMRSMRALKRADVALLLIDATEGITTQDAHIAGMIKEEGMATIVLVNKWDAVEKDSYTIHEFEEVVRRELNFMPYVPLLFISAESGQRVHKILPLVKEVEEARYFRIPTGELNRMMREIVAKQPPPGKIGQGVRFYYVTQPSVAPPVFVFFVNQPENIHFSYKRYLENQIREQYPFPGSPIRLVFRGREEEGGGAKAKGKSRS